MKKVAGHIDSRGGKRALLLYHAYRWIYAPLPRATLPTDARRLVFVCWGNINRSAFAEQVAASLGLPATSAGLQATPGTPASEQARLAAASRGFDLTMHGARSLAQIQPTATDYILAMEPAQLRLLTGRTRTAPASSMALLGNWGHIRRPYLHDPVCASPAFFDLLFGWIQEAVENLAAAWPSR